MTAHVHDGRQDHVVPGSQTTLPVPPTTLPPATTLPTTTLPAPTTTTMAPPPAPTTTTTTAPPAPQPVAAPVAQPVATSDATSTDTADWACIRQAESGDDYSDPAGAYGIEPEAWAQFGDSAYASPGDAPPAVQDEAALAIYAANGDHFAGAWYDPCVQGQGGDLP